MNPDLDAEWTRCKPWIEAALARSDDCYNIDDVKAEIDERRAILWPGKDCACVTSICIYPRKTHLCYWLAGGSMKELIGHMLPVIEDFARKAGFDRLSVPGRKGWLRVMGQQGYVPTWHICTKEL